MAYPGTLMVAFAHPDDETFGMGGTLALYAARGYRVVVITATRGEAGEIQDPSMQGQGSIVDIRQRELQCACEALGIDCPHYLGYRDSGMAGTPDNERGDSFHRANLDEAIEKVVAAIRTDRPQVLVTSEPGGGYGHPDHIKIHQVATRAFHLAGDPSRYPRQRLRHWQPQKLYYVVRPRRFFRAIADYMRQLGIDPNQTGHDYERRGEPDEAITTEIDVSDVTDRKRAAFHCHRSQLSPDGWLGQLLPKVWKDFMEVEHFRRVVPETVPSEVERDLFVGLFSWNGLSLFTFMCTATTACTHEVFLEACFRGTG